MAALQLKFSTAGHDDTRLQIAQCLFGNSCKKLEALPKFRQYFEYYDRQIDALQHQVQYVDDWDMKSRAIATHHDMLEFWKVLRTTGDVEKMEDRMKHLRKAAHSDQAKEPALSWATTVTLRLCLMVDIADASRSSPSQVALGPVWHDDMKIEAFLDQLFPPPKWLPTAPESRPDPDFNVAFMIDVCGLKIEWTDSLPDHLRLNRSERRLAIFSHKRYLQALREHEEYAGKAKQLGLWPKALVEETVQSLLLLFPIGDNRTEMILTRAEKFKDTSVSDWMFYPWRGLQYLWRTQVQTVDVEAEQVLEIAKRDIIDVLPTSHPHSLGLNDFVHWRDRLLDLRQEVYLAPPADWEQIFRDKRNPQQYWTFMFALIILGLTIVTTVTAILSSYTGWVSMKVALAQAAAPQQTVFCQFNTSLIK